MLTVHLFDPQLSGQGGHYLNHDAQLIRDLQRRGIAVRLYGRIGATVTVEGLVPAPVFSQDIFQEMASDPAVWAMENFHTINDAFFADLARLPVGQFSQSDLIYVPNLLQNQLQGLARWLGSLPEAHRPAVAVMLRYLNHAMDYVQSRANKDLIALYYRYTARVLKSVQPRSTLCADTRELAAAYQQITSQPVLELPNPMDVASLVAVSASAAETPPVSRPAASTAGPLVVYQGHTSALRGFHFLPDIIDRCAKLVPRPRFLVQVQNRESAAGGGLGPALTRLDRLAATPGSGVKLVEGALSPGDYFEMLGQADLILLPYSPTFYGFGSSGVFTESASAGKVVVVSPNTVPARQGVEYGLGVVTAQTWDPASMAEAVAKALSRLPELRAQAAAAAPRFRSEQSAQVLWDKVFALPTLALDL